MKKYLLLALLPFLYACSDSPNRSINYDEAFAKDTQGLDILTGQFSHNIDRIWGVNELLVASRKDYVKYTDSFYTRSHVILSLKHNKTLIAYIMQLFIRY